MGVGHPNLLILEICGHLRQIHKVTLIESLKHSFILNFSSLRPEGNETREAKLEKTELKLSLPFHFPV